MLEVAGTPVQALGIPWPGAAAAISWDSVFQDVSPSKAPSTCKAKSRSP